MQRLATRLALPLAAALYILFPASASILAQTPKLSEPLTNSRPNCEGARRVLPECRGRKGDLQNRICCRRGTKKYLTLPRLCQGPGARIIPKARCKNPSVCCMFRYANGTADALKMSLKACRIRKGRIVKKDVCKKDKASLPDLRRNERLRR